MTDSVGHTGEDEGGVRIGDLLGALYRRAWWIALIASVATFVAVAVAVYLPNQYEAIATVQIDPRKKTIVSLDAVLPDIAGDTPTIESQVEIIRSRVIALKVIDALGLRQDPEFGGVPDKTATTEKSATSAAGDKRLEAALDARRVLGPDADTIGRDQPELDVVATEFASRLKTLRVRNSLVVEINFRSRDPVKAARIANTIAEVYIRDQIDMKIKATGLAAELLGPRLEGLRAKVAEAEHRVARFKADNGIVDTEGQLLSEKQLARLMEQTVAARGATAEARAKYEQLQALLRGGASRNIGDVLTSHTVTLLKDQLAKSTKREAELLTKYGPKHPEIAKVRAEIADIESQISREADQITANVKREYDVASERERTLEANLTDLKQKQSVTKELTVKLHDLERDAETSRKIFETFLARYKQTVETQELHLPDARIVEKADVPLKPVAPKRKQIVLIGLVLGLGLGIGLVLLLEFLRTGMSRAEDAQTLLGAPLLSSVPMLKRRSDGLTDPMLSLRIVLAQPRGAFARAIATLRDNLDHQRTDSGPRIVLVTASLPGEGSTLIAANLALAMSGTRGRTLLIDADLRRSKLTHQLGLEQAPGLIDAIGHGQDFESVILKDTVSGLAVIPAGDVGRFPLLPQEALEAPGFAHRLARLKTYFDTIIIDAPPLLPVVDSRILAGYADQVLFVAAWRKTPRDLIRRAVRALGSNAARLRGVVLNQVDPQTHAASQQKASPGNRYWSGRTHRDAA
ncbi:MAG: GNVR domain-containing protein [Hyphomicrobiaceae bacterium]